MAGTFFKKQKFGSSTRLALWALLLCAGLSIACRGPSPEEYIHQLKSKQKTERTKAANQLIRFDADEVVPLLIEEADSATSCLLYTSPSPRDRQKSRMPSSA